MRIVGLACVITLLTAACASVPSPALSESDWAEVCYTGFARDVASLAGDGAVDCGFYRSPDAAVQRAAQACMRQAEQEGRAFMAGYLSNGFDSAYCHAVVGVEAGRYFNLMLDFDVMGQFGTSGSSQSVLWLSRCTSLRYRKGTMGAGSFFDTESCEEAPEVHSALPSFMDEAPAEAAGQDGSP